VDLWGLDVENKPRQSWRIINFKRDAEWAAWPDRIEVDERDDGNHERHQPDPCSGFKGIQL